MSDRGRKRQVEREINRALSKLQSEQEINEVLTNVLNSWDPQRADASLLLDNLQTALERIGHHEHQSGLFRTIVASVCGTNINNSRLAELLGIHRKSVAPAKKRRLQW